MLSINRNRGKRLSWCAALALTPLLIGLPSQSGLASGTKKSANKMPGDKKSTATPAVDQAAMAARLALRGEKARSPILMLAAAELLSGLREGKAKSATTVTKSADTKTTPKKDAKKQTGELSIANLVDKALEFARGDKQLTALVEKRAERLSSRGLVASQGAGKTSIRIRGTTFKIISRGYIRPGYRLAIKNVRFEGRRPARIVIVGDGDGDLDLWVYDGNNGVLIRKDTDRSSVCAVGWTPRYTGPFKVVVRNVGRVTEKYYVLANW